MCALVAKILPDEVVRWCSDGDFLRPVFSVNRVPHVSDLHPKFALRPHHMWKYGRHPIIQYATAEIRRGKKKERRNHRAKI